MLRELTQLDEPSEYASLAVPPFPVLTASASFELHPTSLLQSLYASEHFVGRSGVVDEQIAGRKSMIPPGRTRGSSRGGRPESPTGWPGKRCFPWLPL